MTLHEYHPHIRWTAKKIALIFFFTMLIFVFTLFAIKKTPAGYLNFGNTFVILISLYFGPEISVFSAGVGSALADLALRRPDIKLGSLTTFAGAIIGSIYCVILYTIASGIKLESVSGGLNELKWLALEGGVTVILFYAVGFIVSKTRLYKMLYS